MALLRCMFLIGSILLFCNMAVAVYTQFFNYGDRDGDNMITDNEAAKIKNLAWQFEWNRLKTLMVEEIQKKLDEGKGVTREEFMEMSIPNGKWLL